MRRLVFATLSACLLNVHTIEASSNASLVGSPNSQLKQNVRAEIDGLPVIRDDADLLTHKEIGTLVPIPKMVRIDPRLNEKWHWCTPDATFFLGDVEFEFAEIFGHTFQVNSAVRTAKRQLEIARGDKVFPPNGNTAPVSGPKKSSHLTGATIDIAKVGLTKAELDWLRKKLLALEAEDRIEATEEQDQLVFHVMVFRTYSQPMAGN